jgi:hypothetical protein
MTARTATVLKGLFGGGDNAKVTETKMSDLIDSVTITGTAATSTTALTSITASAPAGSADYAIQDLVQNTGFGFVTADEGQSVLKVILNLQTRLAEVEVKLKALGIMV